MSKYIEKNCDALMVALDHAATLKRHRLAGYTANLDFWVKEVDHVLFLIDNYEERRRISVKAMDEMIENERQMSFFESRSRLAAFPREMQTQTNWDKERKQLASLRKKLLSSIEAFFRRCQHEGLLEQQQTYDLEDRFSINIRKK